ncbi:MULTISPECIES: type I toxin-antitoxin system Fst family toxin [Lactobacillus]|jgi:hypothetical protein|uniref:Type I toxin-antitoxin system Fst family toxin n=1 Tax=Lactobacillus johnsonii TaxID=33959 RepID=A0A9X7XVI9_LACJH|nr:MULTISPECIES: type I toxin-antitoxin system Fst family toxin [Lactobacillus]QIA88654.1 type I toxin-antitoxin system Fst family toxin [Lactobacillus johnsonii]
MDNKWVVSLILLLLDREHVYTQIINVNYIEYCCDHISSLLKGTRVFWDTLLSSFVAPIMVGICLKLFERWLDARDKKKKENSCKR